MTVRWSLAVVVFASFAASVVCNMRISLFSSSDFFSSNCARLLILYINYRRGQDTMRGFKVKLNNKNKVSRSP